MKKTNIIMSATLILKELEALEKKLICNICKMRCNDPIKIRVCGHYFCKKCFGRQSGVCPQCKAYFEPKDVREDNILRKAEPLLDIIKNILANSNGSIGEQSLTEDLVRRDCTSVEGNILEVNQKKYKIVFVDNLCTKTNAKGETPLHLACKRKKLQEVEKLLGNHMDINTQDFAGWTPLHESVEAQCLEIVEILIKRGALLDVPGGEYTTPLHKAASLDNEEIVALLLRHGADKNVLDYFGKKPSECSKNRNIQNQFDQNLEVEKHEHVILVAKKVVAFCYYVEAKYKEELKNAKITIADKYDAKKVTHFIIRQTHRPSLNMLLAMLDGCTIAPQDWIDNLLNGDYFIPISRYTFVLNEQLNSGIRKAMLNALLKLPKLFDGINFYISGLKESVNIDNVKINKTSLTNLIVTGGGRILQRAPTPSTCEDTRNFPYHADKMKNNDRCCHYIIYAEENPPALRYQMAEIRHRSCIWIVECVINFTILE